MGLAERGVVAVAGVLLGVLAFLAAGSPAAAEPDPARLAQIQGPMVFALVRGRSEACEPTCPEWISAEGTITDNSPVAFRKILERIGGRKLPVIVSSAGGSIKAALELGELIRQKGLRTIAGQTDMWNCVPSDPECRPADGLYRGEASSSGFCHSACTIMFAGGLERRAAQYARLAVHMPYTLEKSVQNVYERKYKIVNGKKVRAKGKRMKKRIIRDTIKPISARELDQIGDYFGRMGVSRAIIEMYRSTPPQDMRMLLQYEIRELNLVTDRGGVEALVAPGVCLGEWRALSCVTRKGARVSPL